MDEIEKNLGGRPRKEIDLNDVKKLCQIQCTAEEISGVLEVDDNTLVARIKEAGYESFSEFFKKYSAGGKASLRRSQFKLAEAGNATMQVWLGKQYLGQKDKYEHFNDGIDAIEITHSIKFDENTKEK